MGIQLHLKPRGHDPPPRDLYCFLRPKIFGFLFLKYICFRFPLLCKFITELFVLYVPRTGLHIPQCQRNIIFSISILRAVKTCMLLTERLNLQSGGSRMLATFFKKLNYTGCFSMIAPL